MPLHRLVPLISLITSLALPAQDPSPSKLDLALTAAAVAAADPSTIASGLFASEPMRARLLELVDAMGTRPERRANELLSGWIQRKDGRLEYLDPEVQALLDEVSYQRSRGRPERLLLPILALRAVCPDDPRVLYAMGEAYGVTSPIFNAKQSADTFRALLPLLRDKAERAKTTDERTLQLSAFLPELAADGVLPGANRKDMSFWLRQQVLGFLDALDTGRPIAIWQLADPQLDDLYEELVLMRRKGNQKGCVEVLEAMLAMQRSHPVHIYALAEVRASLGPMFDAAKAVALLEDFLELTNSATVGSAASGADPVLSREDLARQVKRFQSARKRDDLEEQRIFAREIRMALKENPDRPHLIAPDKESLSKKINILRGEATKKAAEIKKVEDHKAENTKRLNDTRNTRDDRADPSRKRERIQHFNEEIEKDEKKLEKLRPVLEAIRAELEPYEDSLRQFS